MKPGDRFDRFRIDAVLGAGGMGEVFAAWDTRLQRKVALKVLHRRHAHEGEEATARILREARAAAALDHAGVVRVFDVAEHQGTAFMVMELVAGTSLRTLIDDETVPAAERLRWLTDIARTLAHAHRAGLIHRDIKPENVMIAADGGVKVLDFGIAKRAPLIDLDESSADTLDARPAPVTAAGAVVGTPIYMAPEQLRGEPLDARCDQFAWGVMAHEVMARKLPWSLELGLVPYISALVSQDAPPLEADAGASLVVADVVARALSRSREDRFAMRAGRAGSLQRDAAHGAVRALARRGRRPNRDVRDRPRGDLGLARSGAGTGKAPPGQVRGGLGLRAAWRPGDRATNAGERPRPRGP